MEASFSTSNGNISVFNDLLINTLELAENKFNELGTTTDVATKQTRLQAAEKVMNEANQLKKSFIMEVAVMKSAAKAPFRALQDQHTARLYKIEQGLKIEKASIEKSLLKDGGKSATFRVVGGPNNISQLSEDYDEVHDKVL